MVSLELEETMIITAVLLLLSIPSTTLAHALLPYDKRVAAEGRTESSQLEEESSISLTGAGLVSGSQRLSSLSVAAETQAFANSTGGVITHSDPLYSPTVHAAKPAKPVGGASNSVLLLGVPATFHPGEEAADQRARSLSGPHIRPFGGDRLRFNKYCGLGLILLAAVLWLVQFGLKRHPAVQELEGAYDGAPPRVSTIRAASHALNSRQGRSILLMLAMLPFWQGLTQAGAARLLVWLYEAAQQKQTAAFRIPRPSGDVELMAFLTIVFAQEMPLEFIRQNLGFQLSAFAPGLLVAGLLLFAVSLYNIAQWRNWHRAQRLTGRPVLRLEGPPVAIAGSGQ